MENGGTQGIQFVVSLVLAHLLTPDEHGVLTYVIVFITIANVFIQSGFNTSLIQKKNSDELDFSTVFYIGLAIAAIMYIILFAAAPFISWVLRDTIDLPDKSILVKVIRVISIVLFFGAVTSVQNAVVAKKMEFKGLFFATLTAVIASGVISIAMAYKGMGVWAMVGQQISYYVCLMLVLFKTVSWRPKLIFSIQRAKTLFSFGWKLLCSSLIDTIYNSIYPLVIGYVYGSSALAAQYTKGDQFPKLITNNLGIAIQSVMLPAFSANQNDRSKVKSMMRRSIVTSSFVILPMMAGLIAVAKPMVLVLLGEQWLPCVPFLQLMCIAYSFWPIHIANLQAINAVGRSDIFLKLEIIKKTIGIIGLLIGIRYNVYVLVIAKAAIDFVCTFINAWPNKKLLNYSIVEQWRDILPSMALSIVMGVCVYFVQFAIKGNVLTLLVQLIVGAVIYIGLAKLLKMESFAYLLDIIKSKLVRKQA
ncbi:MAG: lipopolysaccharide biosynthesis protein [Lachnospiraceae bacterium]|nr:lipopolysaccharide biosynthesis protein [Lachnospiraceae bacterium]